MIKKKKISLARDIFERKEREEMKKQNHILKEFKFPIRQIHLSPQSLGKIRELFEEEAKRTKRDNNMERIKKFVGSIFFLLALFTVTLGCIWLIKIFLRGIFG